MSGPDRLDTRWDSNSESERSGFESSASGPYERGYEMFADLPALESVDSVGEFDDALLKSGDVARSRLTKLSVAHVFEVAHLVLLSVVVWKLNRKAGA